MRALATSFNEDGTEREQNAEIVRILRADKKVLIRFDGNDRVYVKSISNVLPIRRPGGTFAGGGGRSA